MESYLLEPSAGLARRRPASTQSSVGNSIGDPDLAPWPVQFTQMELRSVQFR